MGGLNVTTFNEEIFNPDLSGSVPAGATLNRGLLYAALRKAGVTLTPGRKQGPSQIADALAEEQRMLAGWNLNPLVIYGERIDLYDTVSRQQSYTIGVDPTGTLTPDWEGERPQKIIRANLLLPTASDPITKSRRRIAIMESRDWMRVRYQAVYTYPAGLFPLFNDPQKTPFMRIYFHPIPDAVYQIEVMSWQKIQRFLTPDDAVLLPDGYEDAIVNNLAVRLASYPWTFQRKMDPQVKLDALMGLALIQQMNATPPRADLDELKSSRHGWYNYLNGSVER